MVDGKCLKWYPRGLVAETITGKCGYPPYCRRSTADNGTSTIVKVNQQDIKIDNRLLVPYSPIPISMHTSMMNIAIPSNL